MPQLTWPGKQHSTFPPARLIADSQVFPSGRGYPDSAAPDRLILGDNGRVMSSLLPELAGKVDLIYADPPFFTNRHYRARIGHGEDSRRPEQWALAEGYGDNWPDLDSYLTFLYPRLALMQRLLSPRGTLYVHLDWHASPYARVLLDEIFGPQNLLNEIVWTYHGPSPIRRAFNRKHDTILAYANGAGYTFNADAIRTPYNPATIRTFQSSPKAGFGKVPELDRGKVPEDWWYFPVVARLHRERTGYPTQKPEALLERIILASSNPGDLVADFFCGSGTSVAVAARHGRCFLAVDNSHRAVHTTRSRLCLEASRPFLLEREEACEWPRAEAKEWSAAVSSGGIRLEGDAILDYWEVDPDWQGGIFKSAAQAQRRRGSSETQRELHVSIGRRVGVRTIDTLGACGEQVLDV